VVLGLAIALLLYFGLADPLRILTVPFFTPQDRSDLRLGLTTSRINLVDSAIQLHFHVNGSLPAKLDELVAKHYVSQQDIVDGWSRPFAYSATGDSYILADLTTDGRIDERMKFQRTLSAEQQKSASRQNAGEAVVHIQN
jgi:hypothetical protein